MGGAYQAAGSRDKAKSCWQEGLGLAEKENYHPLVASLLNNLGNLYLLEGNYVEAKACYEKGLTLAREAHEGLLTAHILANLAAAFIKEGNKEGNKEGKYQEALSHLTSARDTYLQQENSHEQAIGLINLAQSYLLIDSKPGYYPQPSTDLRKQAEKALMTAISMAEALADHRVSAQALGLLGQIYEEAKAYDQALFFTRQAIFTAQQQGTAEVLYLRQWQIGRLFKALGQIDLALTAFREAVFTLRSLDHEFLTNCETRSGFSFQESVQPVYFGLAELLLEQASLLEKEGKKAERESYLLEARETIELLKAAELRDYFQDPCLGEYQAKSKPLEGISDSTAIIYIITLPDRIKLLLSLSGEISNFSVQADAQTFHEEVYLFRKGLENRTTREYLPHAQKLYHWLIEPIEKVLVEKKINTLVLVTEGDLRKIPLAALYDGRYFLIEKFALANTLGLNLTDPRPIKREGILTLLAGLTEPVQGYTALPKVAQELEAVKGLYQGKLLLNQDLTIQNLKKELEESSYNIVHLASHAEFRAEAKETHLLAWDSQISMDDLSLLVGIGKFRPKPVELLILSACQTAVGDEKAALGLAGVAVKAGARSALATLWRVDDSASAELMIEFYQQLRDSSISKARALQLAQIKILKDEHFRHPCYWSPFLLIGNWL